MHSDSLSSHAPAEHDQDAVEIKEVSSGLGAWVIAIPFALICCIAILVKFDLHPLWGIPIYILIGSITGAVLTLAAMFRN